MSNLKLNSILLIFLLIGIVFAYFPIDSSVHLYSAIASGSDRIAFDIGAYYLSGGGLLFTVGPLWVLLLLAFGNDRTETTKEAENAETKRVEWIVYTFFGACLACTFILPQVMSIEVGDYLDSRGYTYCDKLSTQWLFNHKMVYTKNNCTNTLASDH